MSSKRLVLYLTGLSICLAFSASQKEWLRKSDVGRRVEIRAYSNQLSLLKAKKMLPQKYPEIKRVVLRWSHFEVQLKNDRKKIDKIELYPIAIDDPRLVQRVGLIDVTETQHWALISKEHANHFGASVGDPLVIEHKGRDDKLREVAVIIKAILPNWYDDFSTQYIHVSQSLFTDMYHQGEDPSGYRAGYLKVFLTSIDTKKSLEAAFSKTVYEYEVDDVTRASKWYQARVQQHSDKQIAYIWLLCGIVALIIVNLMVKPKLK